MLVSLTSDFLVRLWQVGFLSGWFALSHPDMPRPLMILATIVIALIAGGIVGAIPGILRAYLGTSEVIVTIMMNYICLVCRKCLYPCLS